MQGTCYCAGPLEGMLLLRPALWTLDDKDQAWAASFGYMDNEEPQSSVAPADTVAYHPAGRQDGLSLAGMELFASVDMDALMGTTATVSAAHPAAATEPPPISGPHPGHAFPTLALGEGRAHAAAAKPGQVTSHMPPDAAAPIMLPAVNIVMTQHPDISVMRPGQPGLVPRQPGLALMPSWTSASVPLPAPRELPPSSSMRVSNYCDYDAAPYHHKAGVVASRSSQAMLTLQQHAYEHPKPSRSQVICD